MIETLSDLVYKINWRGPEWIKGDQIENYYRQEMTVAWTKMLAVHLERNCKVQGLPMTEY